MKQSVFLLATVAASDRDVIRSEFINNRFFLEKVIFRFPPNSKRKLKARFWVGAGEPPGSTNVVQLRGNVDYVVGDGDSVEMYIGAWFEGGNYCYGDGENTSTTDTRTLDVHAVIDREV